MNSIGPSLTITGEIRCDDDLLIEARVNGTIHVSGAVLTLGPQARIDGDVRGERVSVDGTVRGTIAASQRIERAASASVKGNLTAEQIVIVDGARFDGRIDMTSRSIPRQVEQFHRTHRG